MSDLNLVSIIGRLTRDVELKYTTTGTAIAELSIACNRSVKRGESWETDVSYFDATMYGRMAEGLKPYLTKGKMVAIIGHLKQDRWEKNGQKFSKLRIEVEELQLLGGNSVFPNNNAVPHQVMSPVPSPTAPSVPESTLFSNEDFPEDIPF
jgi:single-strand DNA-binding protein